MEDEKIIDLLFERNQNALHLTREKYGRVCFSVAKNVLRSDQEAEECVNDAYLALWNKIPPARPSYFGAFLCKITRNLAIKRLEYLRAAKRKANVISLDEIEEILPDEQITAADQQLTELLEEFLRREKPEARNVFLRRYWFFDSVGQIAHRYGFSQSKVKSMLFQSRKRLREFLQKEGVTV